MSPLSGLWIMLFIGIKRKIPKIPPQSWGRQVELGRLSLLPYLRAQPLVPSADKKSLLRRQNSALCVSSVHFVHTLSESQNHTSAALGIIDMLKRPSDSCSQQLKIIRPINFPGRRPRPNVLGSFVTSSLQ